MTTVLLSLAALGGQAEDFTYVTNNGTITITGYAGPGGDISVPGTVGGLPVTAIGPNAFYMNTTVTGITLPNSVTNIEDYAFEHSQSLRTVNFGSYVARLGDGAFFQCPGLTNVVIPNGVTTIGYATFYQCGLRSVSIPSTVTSIGVSAFFGCAALTQIELPTNLASIGYQAFASCGLLGVTPPSAIIVPGSVTNIDERAFADSGFSAVNILAGLTNIPPYLFNDCQSLKSVSLPGSVVTIGEAAFSGCSSLSSIVLPEAVTSIGGAAFSTCPSLTNVIFGPNITNIGQSAFYGCTSLIGITLPKSLAALASFTFENCIRLAGAYFQGSTPSAPDSVFSGDTNLTVYYLPGTTGWGATFGGRPALLWNPQVQTGAANFGVQPTGFGLPIIGTPDIPIVLEASPAPAGANWLPVQSRTLNNGSLYLTDPDWTNYPARFYRLRSP